MLQKHKDLQLQGEWRGQEKEEQSGCGLTWSDVALTVPCPLPRSGRAARIPVRHCELSTPATLNDAKKQPHIFSVHICELEERLFYPGEWTSRLHRDTKIGTITPPTDGMWKQEHQHQHSSSHRRADNTGDAHADLLRHGTVCVCNSVNASLRQRERAQLDNSLELDTESCLNICRHLLTFSRCLVSYLLHCCY